MGRSISRATSSIAALVIAGVVLGSTTVSCGSSDEGDGLGDVPPYVDPAHTPMTMDDIENGLLDGVDDPVEVSDAVLDTDFPLVERLTKPEVFYDRDPTKGTKADLEAALAAFTTTENADDHFTIDVIDTGVPATVVDRVKKGLLFALANRDAFIPGFSVMDATNKKTGGKPFFVTITTKIDPTLGDRPYVSPCGGGTVPADTIEDIVADIDGDTCIPRMVLQVKSPPDPNTPSVFHFVHESAHIWQDYWEQSAAYVQAGGIKAASRYHAGFGWQAESDAEHTSRHAPDLSAYQLTYDCPFEPLRRGAFSWQSTSAVGADAAFPYEMAIFLDQVTWHRFNKDPGWLRQWLIAEVDPRSKATPPLKPYSPARRLMKLVSKDPNKTELSAFNRVLVQAGVDLYWRGRDPWTTNTLYDGCVRPTATVDLPLLSFDALRVDVGDLSKVAKLRVALDASRDPSFLRAGVAAVDLDDAGKIKFIDCAKNVAAGALGGTDPRLSSCQEYIHPLTTLSPKNNLTDEVQLPVIFGANGGKYAIVALVFHLMPRADVPRTPINVTFRAEPIATPPGKALDKSLCGALTDSYRSHCKTSDCLCIGNAYCEATADQPPLSCEDFYRSCAVFCLFQSGNCDCISFCDRLRAAQGCH